MAISITFRTDDMGKWGAGLGADLTAAQVDINFWNLKTAVEAIQSTLPENGVGIDTITVVGNQMSITLTDASIQGPFTLPAIAMVGKGVWIAATPYNQYDIVSYGSIAYLVNFAHTSAATFDPLANDGFGNYYYSVFVDLSAYTVPAGGLVDQILTKNSGTDYDMSWKTVASGGQTSVALTYESAELITDGTLGSNPTGAAPAWTIGDSSWTSGQLHIIYNLANDPIIQVPISGLVVGGWYVFSFTGEIYNDVNYLTMQYAAGKWYRPGAGSFIFKALNTSDNVIIDMSNYTDTAERLFYSASCRKIAATSGVVISDGISPVTELGYDQDNILIGEGVARWYDRTTYGTNVAPPLRNVVIGLGAMENAGISADDSIAIGNFALKENNSVMNIAIGTMAVLRSNAGWQVGVGNYALADNNGGSNTAVGNLSQRFSTSGSENVSVGEKSLEYGLAGSRNVAVGNFASYLSDGSDNTAVGYFAGSDGSTDYRCTYVGSGAQPTSGALTNSIAIGYNSVVLTSNSVQLGNTNVKKLSVGPYSLGEPRHLVIAGAAPGSHYEPEALVGDRIDEAIYYPSGGGVQDITGLTTISSNTQITISGTDTTGGYVIFRWTKLT